MPGLEDMRAQFPRPGRLEWIGISSQRRADVLAVDEATVQAGTGIKGDYHAASGKSDRQITLIQHEHLPTVARLTGREAVGPEQVRRNLAVSGINVMALKDRRFRVGEVLLEGSGPCDPCSRMEENLGRGGYNAMHGHGGIAARVLEGGHIQLGDPVTVFDEE